MTDQTLLIGTVLLFVKLVFWAFLVVYVLSLGRRIAGSVYSDKYQGFGLIVKEHQNRIILCVIILILSLYITSVETAYRPKAELNSRNEYQERMRAEKGRSVPVIPESAPVRPSWDEEVEKNREENERARKEFEALSESR